MSSGAGPGPEPTEAELRALEELRRVPVEQVLLQTIVSLVHLAGWRMGLAPGAETERDLGQVSTAIDAVQALMPLVDAAQDAPDLAPIRDALAQLQVAYATEVAQGAPAPEPSGDPAAAPREGEEKGEREAGPARSSGRLWIPGQ